MRKRATSVGLVTVLVGLLCVVAPTHSAVAGTTTVPRPDHVVIVVEENHSAQNIIGNPSAPFINALAAAERELHAVLRADAPQPTELHRAVLGLDAGRHR